MFKFIKFVIAFSFILVGLAFADDEVAVPSVEARQWAHSKGYELLETLAIDNPDIKFAKLDKMMLEDVNLDYIAKFVLGKYVKLMTNEQKQRYHTLFNRYVLSLYKRASFKFDARALGFSIDSVTEYPKFTNVSCSVNPGEIAKDITIEKIPVRFKLIRGIENRIQAVDVEISGISLVIEYRKRFYQLINEEQENMEWFLEKFEDKVRANEEAVYKNTNI